MKPAPVIEFPPHEGYPADYLVARLGGRRSLMLRNWEALLLAERPALPARYAEHAGGRPEDAVARALTGELRWVARQMDSALREVFSPVFIYFELETLFSCIRYRSGRDTGKAVETALALSLLSSGLKSALLRAASRTEAMAAAEEAFLTLSETYQGVFGAEGSREAEQRLTDAFLKDSAARAAHPVIRGFFRTVIDMRNMVSVYKRLRWGIETAPPLIEGGNVGTARLRGMASEAALLHALRRFTGLPATRVSDAERLFLLRLMAYAKEASRGAGTVGAVLSYLLECHSEARNLSLILSGRVLEREILRGELVA